MMTREEVAEIMAYCKGNSITYKIDIPADSRPPIPVIVGHLS